MKRQLLFLILAVLFVTWGSSVHAAEAKQQETVFTVTPRVWFAFADVVDESWYNADSIFIPMYGLTVSVAPRFIPNWSFLVTGLYGTADGDIIATEDRFHGSADYERLDIEFLVRYTFPGTGLSLFVGPRYVNWKAEQKVELWYPYPYKAKTKTDLWAGEVGAGYVHTIGESGKHRCFSNLTLGIARIDSDWSSNLSDLFITELRSSNKDTEPMVDANIGYEYLFTSSGSVSLRYRIFTMREQNDYKQHRWRTFHGPEIGLSFRF